jgi:hypothetical protein
MPEKPKRGESPSPIENPQGRTIGALVLIALGIIFLLQSNGFVVNFAWWAVFILIPGALILGRGIMTYSQTGSLDSATRGSITGGTILLMVGAIFLFDLDWGKVWPVFLIVPGVFMLMGLYKSDKA